MFYDIYMWVFEKLKSCGKRLCLLFFFLSCKIWKFYMGDLYFLCDKIKEGFNFVIEFYFYDIFNRVG